MHWTCDTSNITWRSKTFKWRLKMTKVSSGSLRLSGNAFQTDGLPPTLILWRGVTRGPLSQMAGLPSLDKSIKEKLPVFHLKVLCFKNHKTAVLMWKCLVPAQWSLNYLVDLCVPAAYQLSVITKGQVCTKQPRRLRPQCGPISHPPKKNQN